MKRLSVALHLALVLFVLPAYPADQSVEGRSTSFKTCGALLERLGVGIANDERLDKLGVRNSQIKPGYLFISKSGQTVHRPFGAGENAELQFREISEVKTSLQDLAKEAAQRSQDVVVSGDIPLDRLVDNVKLANLGPLRKHVLVSLNPESVFAQAKKRLLDSSFQKVEIVIDMPPGPVAALFQKHATVVGGHLPESGKKVLVFTPDQLGNKGTFADRLMNNPPTVGTLRISIAHHSAGSAAFSDGSTLAVPDFYAKCMRDGRAECFLGCNLSYDPQQWFVYDGELFAAEVGTIANDLEETLKSSEATGRNIMHVVSATVLPNDAPPGVGDQYASSGNGGARSGGNDPPGGSKPPGGVDGPEREKSTETTIRVPIV